MTQLSPATSGIASAASSLLNLFDVTDEDLARVAAFGTVVTPKLADAVAEFYLWLETQPEYAQQFGQSDTLARVKSLQREYWAEFFKGAVDDTYVQRRIFIGEVHARRGLPMRIYFASVSRFLSIFERMYDGALDAADLNATMTSVVKLLHLDSTVVADTYSRLTNRLIADQGKALSEMSTPVTTIWDGILMLPVVGIVDSRRAADIMNSVLERVADTQARVLILDISGVAVVDTAVANHFIKVTKATKLMGCSCIISGVSPAIAQTVVELGIDVDAVQTTGSLQDALRTALTTIGVEL